MSDAHALPPKNHNGPPGLLELSDLATMLNPAVVQDQLTLDYAVLTERRDALLAMSERFFDAVKTIEDEDTAARASDFAGQMALLWQDTEAARVSETGPLTAAHKANQSFFKAGILDPIGSARIYVEKKLKSYSDRKAAEKRRELEAQAKAASKAAQEATEAAAESLRPSQLDAAAKLAQESEKLEGQLATATTASLGRVRGTHGSTTTVRSKWDYELVDIELVPREWLTITVNDAKVKQAIANGMRDGADGTPAVTGLRIVDNAIARVRV